MTDQSQLPEELQDPAVAGIVAAFQDRDNHGMRPPGAALQGATEADAAPEPSTVEPLPSDGDPGAGGDEPAEVVTPEVVVPPAPTTYEINGQIYDRETVAQYLAITERMAQLPLDQRRAIDEYVATGRWPEPVSSPSSTPSAAPLGADDGDEYLDPRAAADIAQMRTELAELRTQYDRLAASDDRDETTRVTQVVNAAADAFVAARGWSAEDRDRLMAHAAELQIGPGLLERHRGDYAAAAQSAMEVAMYALPEYRDREVARQTQAAVDRERTDKAARDVRKDKASALAGSSSGSVPRDVAPDRPRNRQESIAAMAQVIREHQQNGVS